MKWNSSRAAFCTNLQFYDVLKVYYYNFGEISLLIVIDKAYLAV